MLKLIVFLSISISLQSSEDICVVPISLVSGSTIYPYSNQIVSVEDSDTGSRVYLQGNHYQSIDSKESILNGIKRCDHTIRLWERRRQLKNRPIAEVREESPTKVGFDGYIKWITTPIRHPFESGEFPW